MDSGTNSASLQSSSTGGVVGGGVGGDEEYDSSRAAVGNSDAFSSAFHTQNSVIFDPFANYFNPIYRPQPPSSPPPPPSQNYTSTGNSIFNIDWSPAKRMRSDQITTNSNPMSDNSSQFLNNSLSFAGTTTPGSISFPSLSEQQHQHRGGGGGGNGGGNVSVATSTEPAAAAAADQPITQPAARNPKKRSRASRRAPTTVLTTDTTNFRAMVQEFTGIPAPPFTTPPSYYPQRNRFDLFGSTPNSAPNPVMRSAAAPASAAAANINPFSISQPPPPLNYLRRAFLQSIQQPQPFISPSSASSSSSSPLMLNCLPNNFASGSSTTSSAANSSINYQLPSRGVVNAVSSASNATINYQLPSSGVASGVANSVTQGSNLFSTIQQNSMFSSLLQSPQKYSIGSKEQEQFQMASNSSSQFQMPSSVNNNIQHGHLLSELPNLISPEQAPATAAAASSNDNSINAANFHGDKVQETVASRGGEGMVESWLLSSD